MKKLIAALALVTAASAFTAGCTPRMAGHLVAAAVVTAAIVGTAHVLAYHDPHFHDPYCGCSHRWHDGRWVYYYQDRWEYYDPDTGRWYYYYE